MFGIDAVLLGEFACKGTRSGDMVIDLGTGNGILPLLMEKGCKASHFTGLEIQKKSVELARRSVELNGLTDKIEIVQGDLKNAGSLFSKHSFNVVVSNPPYALVSQGKQNLRNEKTIARHEVLCTLEDVVAAADYLLHTHGSFFMIHRPFRLPEIFEAYFSNSVRTSDNTKKINDIIDCFKNEKAIQENRQSLFENTEEIDFEKIKNGISGKSVLAGINILYNMQKNGCIDYLNEAEEVNICPATVQVIIEEYMNTGDRNIFDLIINLKNMRNLKIISPDIKTYIALEVNQQNTPGYMIMEKALMAEQMNSITE